MLDLRKNEHRFHDFANAAGPYGGVLQDVPVLLEEGESAFSLEALPTL